MPLKSVHVFPEILVPFAASSNKDKELSLTILEAVPQITFITSLLLKVVEEYVEEFAPEIAVPFLVH